jgi:hypothetical protein
MWDHDSSGKKNVPETEFIGWGEMPGGKITARGTGGYYWFEGSSTGGAGSALAGEVRSGDGPGEVVGSWDAQAAV